MLHERHPALARSQIIDGATLAYAAYQGAAYHLRALTEILNAAEQRTERDQHGYALFVTGGDVDRLHWHLRSFFWELVGAFDLVLQWSNDRFELGVHEGDVKWETTKARTAGRDQGEWDRVRRILDETWESAWYFEVRQYRNFSHRAFLHATAIVGKEGSQMLMLEHARVGQPHYEDVRQHLPKYLEELRRLGAAIFGLAHQNAGGPKITEG